MFYDEYIFFLIIRLNVHDAFILGDWANKKVRIRSIS